jgi:hypothetical protein
MRCGTIGLFLFLVFTSSAFADSTIYGFEGYITSVRIGEAAEVPVPAGFAVGSRISGDFDFDAARRGTNADGDESIMPISTWKMIAASGDTLTPTGGWYSSLSLIRDAQGETVRTGTSWFRLYWHSSESGQLPSDVQNVDLSALDPSHWELVVDVTACDPDYCASELISTLSIHITSLWRKQKTPLVSASQFTNGANGWSVQSGQWAASNGYFRNSSNVAASIATLAPTTEDRYSTDAQMYLEWSAAGNRGGLVYDYVDARNYRGLLLSPAKQNSDGSFRSGSLELFEVRNGARRVVLRREFARWPIAREWVNVGVERLGTTTRVTLGLTPEIDIQQPIQLGSKSAGLLASYNLVRFDDVVFGVTPR